MSAWASEFGRLLSPEQVQPSETRTLKPQIHNPRAVTSGFRLILKTLKPDP